MRRSSLLRRLRDARQLASTPVLHTPQKLLLQPHATDEVESFVSAQHELQRKQKKSYSSSPIGLLRLPCRSTYDDFFRQTNVDDLFLSVLGLTFLLRLLLLFLLIARL